jgi:hypothetical protein
MSRAQETFDSGNVLWGWRVRCPACEAHLAETRPDLALDDRIFYAAHTFDKVRWGFNGDLERPTFEGSMLSHPNGLTPRCHSVVTGGDIDYCDEPGQRMAGQTVALPDFDA